MKFCGIDPGRDGFAAVINEDGTVDAVPFSESNYVQFFSALRGQDAFAVLERVHSSPQMGVASAFAFGENFGFVQGVLRSERIPYELVLPQKWKKFFGATSDKNTSIAIACRLFPAVDMRATPRCKKAHDGKAESILLAEYGRRIYNPK